MNTKTCEKCGWVLDIRDPHTRCPVCGTKFQVGICYHCKQVVQYYRPDRNMCKHCYDTITRKPKDKQSMNDRRRAFYEEWIEKISKIPHSYPTLTEEQWLAAVKHFNGCALCKNTEVESRGYFVPYGSGGRYCDWNIIPMCFECSTSLRRNPNYFLYDRPEGLPKIVDYLEVRINAALATDAKHGE